MSWSQSSMVAVPIFSFRVWIAGLTLAISFVALALAVCIFKEGAGGSLERALAWFLVSLDDC